MSALTSVDVTPDPPASLALIGRASVNMPPEPSSHCSERYFATLLATEDASSMDEVATLEAVMNRHLATTRPPDNSVAFKYNVDCTYACVSKCRA